jgi:uncharacterized membrane protein YphA (DoxX/SURF4 family)
VNNGYRVGFWAALSIVALRLIIGWHFLTAGFEKFEPGWTSAGFLRSANGPLAGFFKSMAPLPHNWDQLAGEPLPPAIDFADARRYVGDDGQLQEGPAKNDRTGHIPFPTAAYGPWASQIAEDWTQTVAKVKAIRSVTEEQREAADDLLASKLTRLAQYFEEQRGALDEYHHELGRLNNMIDSDARGELPYLDERILKKKAEVQGMPRPWVADIAAEEELLHNDLISLVTTDQKQSALVESQLLTAIDPPTQLDKIDTAVTVVTLAVGGCLIIGLFTRLAAVVGAGFLLSVMATQPPWAEGVLQTVKLLTAYQGIEFVALLVLAAIGAGRWAGLDGLFWRRVD